MDASDRQLRALLAVHDEGSITRAASTLFVSQPTLSRQLAALEAAAGSALVERLPRGARLTVTGRALLPFARQIVTAHDDLTRAATAVTSGFAGELHLGTLTSLSLGVLPGLLGRWLAARPDVTLHLIEHRHRDDLAAAVRDGQIDLAIGPAPANWEGSAEHLLVEEFVVVGCDDDEPDGTTVDLRALEHRSWVHYPVGNGLGDVLDQACLRAGFAPRVALRTDQASAAVEFATHGFGPALVPDTIVPAHVRSFRAENPIRRDIVVFGRGPSDPLSRSLVREVRRASGQPSE